MRRGQYSRGYLPHLDVDRAQFITWRLTDALPAHVVLHMKEELAHMPEDERKGEYARRIEAYCDAGHGSSVLKAPACARAVQETLFIDHGRRFTLHAWCIMPNHVHVLLTPNEGVTLARILAALKSSSAGKVNKLTGSSGQVWQADYFDRAIRDAGHFSGVWEYIEWNPVKAKLVQDPSLWSWSSANDAARKRLEIVSGAQ